MRWRFPADSMKPAYRAGDVIIVSPAAHVRKGDRVVVKTKDGEVMVKELKRKTAKIIELKSLNAEHRDRTLADVRRRVGRAHRLGESVYSGYRATAWPCDIILSRVAKFGRRVTSQ